MKIKFSSVILILYLFIIASCKKDAGEGGTSSIRGKIHVKKYDNTFSLLLADYYGPNEDTYIIYGTDHTTYDNNYKTSYDGTYEFKYLQKGTYTIFCYSIDTTGVATTGTVDLTKPKIAVSQTVKITDSNQTVEVPEILIFK